MMKDKKTFVVLSGAGISAESGISTFRDANGLWENHSIEEVASIEGFNKNPALVLDFYNQRRAQLFSVAPNEAHHLLVTLEEDFDVKIITQNVDDLHERAGSTQVLHLHGELRKVRPIDTYSPVIPWKKDLLLGDVDERGVQLRPHIVWFGEEVPMMEIAMEWAAQADYFLVIGTSLQVYPAAGLIHFVPEHAKVFSINPDENYMTHKHAIHFSEIASIGMKKMIALIKKVE